MISPNSTTSTPQWIDDGSGRHVFGIGNRVTQLFKSFVVSVSDPLIDDPVTGSRYTVIMALEPPFAVIKPIPVTIEKTDDGYVASFEDANVNSSGDTWDEAVSNLKYLLVDLFDDLVAEPTNTLGPAVQRQIEVMKLFVRKQYDA